MNGAMRLGLLLRIQAYRFCGINSLIHGHDRRQRRRALGRLGMALVLVVMAAGYSALFAGLLAESGVAVLIPRVFALAESMLSLSAVALIGPQQLFGGSDLPSLRAMPVSTGEIVVSRLTAVLAAEGAFALLIGVPAGAVYALHGAGAGGGIRLVFVLLMVPAIPTAAALAIGVLAAWLARGLRHRELAVAILNIALFLAIMAAVSAAGLSAARGTLTQSAILLLTRRFGALLSGVYPPADWAAEAAAGQTGAWLALIASAAAALAALTAAAVALFSPIADALASGEKARRGKAKAIRPKPPVLALYQKEARRYVSSSIYLMNTSAGWLMLLLAVGAVAVADTGWLMALLRAALPEEMPVFSLLPLIPALMAGMSQTTGCSISMEGRQMETMRSLPVSMRDWLGAKLLLSLTPAVPLLALCCAVLSVKLRLTAAQAMLLLLFPLGSALFCGVLGLAFNLAFPRFDWEKEINVVKNSLSVTLSILAGMILPAGIGALCVVSGRTQGVMTAACAAQVVCAALLFGYLARGKMP